MRIFIITPVILNYLGAWVFDCFTKEHAPHPLRYLIAYKNLLRSIENIGIAVVYGIRLEYRFHPKKISNLIPQTPRYYAQGNISQDQYIQVSCKSSKTKKKRNK